MTKWNIEQGRSLIPLNHGTEFMLQVPVEKSVRAEPPHQFTSEGSVTDWTLAASEALNLMVPQSLIEAVSPQVLDLGALGEGLLGALRMMQEPGYEPEPVEISDELLSALLSFDRAE